MNTNTGNNAVFTENEIKDLKWKASWKYYISEIIQCFCILGCLLIIANSLGKQRNFNRSIEDRLNKIELQIIDSNNNNQ